MVESFPVIDILGVPIAAIDLDRAATRIEQLIKQDSRVFVAAVNVHGIMESEDNPRLKHVYHQAELCVPDGMPTVWIGRLRGHRRMQRVYGPDLMLELLRRSPSKGYTHYLFGGRPGTPERLKAYLEARFPGVNIVGTCAPPFRTMSDKEEAELTEEIQQLRPDLFWISLGCPKQEYWMATHVGKLQTQVMIGVGVAFNFLIGDVPQAPRWMMNMGLEWFYRLCREPRRLWRRYVVLNPRFIWRVFRRELRPRRLRAR